MKSLSQSFAATFVIQLANILTGILAARLLLPQGRGELVTIMLWPSILATLGSFGMADACAFLFASKKFTVQQVYGTALIASVVLTVFLMALGAWGIPHILIKQRLPVIGLSLVYLLFIPLNFLTLLNGAVFLGQQRLLEYNILRSLVHVAYLVGVVFLFSLHRISLKGFVVASLGGNIVIFLLGLWWLVKKRWLGFYPRKEVFAEMCHYGIRAHLGSVASFFNLRLDQMLMSIFLSPILLGLYIVGVSISGGVALLGYTISIVAFAHLANIPDLEQRKLVFGRLIRLSLFSSLMAGVFLIFMSTLVIRTFFGAAFLPAGGATRVLCAASIFLGCNMVMAAGVKAYGFPMIGSQAEMVSLSMTVIGLAVLLPRFGIVGAGWASFLAYSTSFIFMNYRLRRRFGVSLRSLYTPSRADWIYAVSLFK